MKSQWEPPSHSLESATLSLGRIMCGDKSLILNLDLALNL